MGFKEIFLKKSAVEDKIDNASREFVKVEKEFMNLTAIMFNKQNADVFNSVMPKRYLPKNVIERIKNSASDHNSIEIYKEANDNYKQIIFLKSCNYFVHC